MLVGVYWCDAAGFLGEGGFLFLFLFSFFFSNHISVRRKRRRKKKKKKRNSDILLVRAIQLAFTSAEGPM